MNARPIFICLLAAGLMAGLSGCGGGAAGPEPATDVQTVAPAGQSLAESGPEVELYTEAGRLIVQGFRIDFPKVRNVHEMVGFIPEDWDHEVRVPFGDLREVVFRAMIDQDTFEKIYKDREQYAGSPDEYFRLQLIYLDGRTSDFVARIPKFRGLKDSLVWDQPMRGNPLRIDRITFRR